MGPILRPTGPFHIKRICIIGAGPSGLAVAKHLLAENTFDQIDIIEQQAEVGGVWNYTSVAELVSVPQTAPDGSLDKPRWLKHQPAPVFSNPMYTHLNTNIPKDLMAFSDLAFPVESLLFPKREDVQEYVIRYAKDIRHLIAFSKQVEDVRHSRVDGNDRWRVTSRSTVTDEKKEDEYDGLVIASGHYSVAFIPSVLGIEAFNNAYPAIISHCKAYRSSDAFQGKKVIVVGGGPSGLDVGTQISKVCQHPLLNSVRSSLPLKLGQDSKEEVPPIVEYLTEGRSVKFEDGRIERNIDAVVYCTGYLYSYPFLKSMDPPLITDGSRVRGLYKQLFNINYPTITFTALSQRVIPFPLSETQGAAIAKVWANKLFLPLKDEMLLWEQKKVEELGDGTSFHLLAYPKDAAYINELYDWVGTAEDGYAKEPAHWGERECWIRENFAELRKRFVEAGGKARTMEELGFDFANRARYRGPNEV